MATIDRRWNKWRIRKKIDGQMYTLNLDYKPKQSEADKLLYAFADAEQTTSKRRTFEQAATNYIKSKDAVLSPTTITAYRSMLRCMPESFKKRAISGIKHSDVQFILNDYSRAHSPKTVRNLSGFISAVITSVRPSWRNEATLPQRQDPEFYVPEKSDVKRILEYAKGTRYELPLWLAVFGLRRSEICAVEKVDLRGNELTIDKALVQNDKKEWILKTTKTVTSTRTITLPENVVQMFDGLPEGRIYKGSPGQINEFIQATQDKLGIPRFSLHKLRHFFASTAREIMPDAYVEQAGGWKPGSTIMRKVYDYAQKDEAKKAKESLAKRFSEIL